MKLKTILIANRGEIACRLIKTCKRMGLRTVAVYCEEEATTPHVLMADTSVNLGEPKNYLDIEAIVKACRETAADAVLPGYGFLSENSKFASMLEANGIVFVGPTVENMSKFALKHKAIKLARELGVPVCPGSPLIDELNEAVAIASKIGYPVLLKSTAGRGGRGIHRCENEAEIKHAFGQTISLASSAFGDGGIYVEKYIVSARHIEIQVFGDKKGNVVCLGERECSVQRRHQKIIEETPSPFLTSGMREAMCATSKRFCEHINYQSAGTVEYVVDSTTGNFYFMEVNPRLQVEHTITEMVSGIDIVEWMLRLALDDPGFSIESYVYKPRGHSIECRVCAEDPACSFRPCNGVVTGLQRMEAPWLRYDDWLSMGTIVTRHFDSLLMKIIVHGDSRSEAIQRMSSALKKTVVAGFQTNLEYVREICASTIFRNGDFLTTMCDTFDYECSCVEVIKPGMYSTLQNWPGRKGYWSIGVPPSGPMDHLSLRVANRLVGNEETACGVEMTIVGMTLKFHKRCTVAVTGAVVTLTYNGEEVPQYTALQMERGGVLIVGTTISGIRTYLAVAGGFDVPLYLGSQSTFVLGHFGGLQGRTLQSGDMLPLSPCGVYDGPLSDSSHLPKQHIPKWSSEWRIGVMYGPHGAPDFFTQEYMDLFWTSTWKVHHNSNRLGIQLIGPKPTWTRTDGGEAGLHPSNIHDCEYAIGSVNFTGEYPVILGVDGPSLGGFVCPVTIVSAELWKMGQLAPGDTVKFARVSFEHALKLKSQQQTAVDSVGMELHQDLPAMFLPKINPPNSTFMRDAIIMRGVAGGHDLLARTQGDEYMLIEYGPMKLDLDLRFCVRVFMEWIESYKQAHPDCGIGEISPGVRSVQLEYNAPIDDVLDIVKQCVYLTKDQKIPCRVIHLPLAFDDKWIAEAIQRYMNTVTNDTPYVPSNIDFVARINGLQSRDDVKNIMLDATYMILGLGDVYLNAPCAVPIDPRHRLVTSKYSPARTFTPEGAVGLGGAYLCIYGMESPGGYQLVGRTLPIWSLWKSPPFLFRFFDQIKFHLVDEDELMRQRKDYTSGRYSIRIENTVFEPAVYRRMLRENADSIRAFRKGQNLAFEAERQRWVDSGMIGGGTDSDGEQNGQAKAPVYSENSLDATIAGKVWKINVNEGDQVEKGQGVAILESMKMEVVIKTDRCGTVTNVVHKPGEFVDAGECIMIIE